MTRAFLGSKKQKSPKAIKSLIGANRGGSGFFCWWAWASPVRNRSVSGLSRDGRSLAIAAKVLTCRFLGWRTRYRKEDKTPRLPKREYLCPCCDFPQRYRINHRTHPFYPQPPYLRFWSPNAHKTGKLAANALLRSEERRVGKECRL